ncbi:formylglycine-generating enzyme family protein [Chitinimonas taiwanensis]|uniref:formylglycine-generating enzyme family protein n=1 Tax=Chitinimonas taiwanensis TaxID=240412 RepID=UPI0035B18745
MSTSSVKLLSLIVTSIATAFSLTSLAGSTASKSAALSIPEASLPPPTLSKVKPPKGNPRISDDRISEEELARLPDPQQAPDLKKYIQDLQVGSLEQRIELLKKQSLKHLIFVQGGTFTMGDFTPLLKIPGVSRMTYNEDDKHLHKVTLSDFYINRYKTTNAELNVFLDATKQPRRDPNDKQRNYEPGVPAGATWHTAESYCQWLGKLNSHTFSLPTEAQWEYAARSRGQFFMAPTDNGEILFGKNVPYSKQAKRLAAGGYGTWHAIGLFPANPLGLYDMTTNGQEWVSDWYAEDAYQHHESTDPQGPKQGDKKVTRGWSLDTLKIGVSVWRRNLNPLGRTKSWQGEETTRPLVLMPSIRCVAQR